jgi:hypothetical protein
MFSALSEINFATDYQFLRNVRRSCAGRNSVGSRRPTIADATDRPQVHHLCDGTAVRIQVDPLLAR